MNADTIFFSYSKSDSAFVLKLANDLRNAGEKIWLDQFDIDAGSHWDESIEAALNSATRLLIVLSPGSVESKNVMDEVSFAIENGKTVIPVLFQECKTPFRLKRLQHIDFTNEYQKGLNQLLNILGSAKGKEKTTTDSHQTKLIVFLSAGGTCRDPMAKAIAKKILESKNFVNNIDIRAMAVIGITNTSVSFAARHAIKNIYGEDLLQNHQPEKITEDIIKRANVILVMTDELMNQLKRLFPGQYNNIYVFKKFFGLKGDIKDPFPDGKDKLTLKRYYDCAIEMKMIMTNNIDKLIEALIL